MTDEMKAAWTFQSTPSAWRETFPDIVSEIRLQFQSTPSAWRETSFQTLFLRCIDISIHSLRMEGDAKRTKAILKLDAFQSTPSAWRETQF